MRRLVVVLALLLSGACVRTMPDPDLANEGVFRGDFESRGFERVADVEGVWVYSREDDGLVRVGAEALVPVPPDKVLAALLDFPRHVDTFPRVAEVRVLEKGSDSMLVYQRLSLPVIDDRDFTIEVSWGRDGDGYHIDYRATRKGPPERDDAVRLSHYYGGWQIRPAPDGASLVSLESNMDLQVSLPRSMLRSGAIDEMPDVIAGLCQLVAAGSAHCPRSPESSGPMRVSSGGSSGLLR